MLFTPIGSAHPLISLFMISTEIRESSCDLGHIDHAGPHFSNPTLRCTVV